MEIGTRIQELRKKKNISQEELANVMNVSRQAVSKWESNLSVPDIEKIIDLSEYFQVSTDYLLKGQELSKKFDANWKEFYPIISLVVKLSLMISLYFIAAIINGLTGTIVYMMFVVLFYLLERKIIKMFSLNDKNIFYELGFIFYSFPFIHVLKTVLFNLFISLLNWSQEYALSLHNKSGLNSSYREIYRSIKNFKEAIYESSWFPTIYIISIYIIVNILIIRHIRKKRIKE